MTFLNTAILAGLAALAVPIVLHLIQKQRYPRRLFTTLRFFEDSKKHNRIQSRLVDKLLLLLRLLALAALVLGLARPFGSFGFGEKRLSLVIVLDNSASMSRLERNEFIFDSAKKTAISLLDELGPNDQVALLLTAGNIRPLYMKEHSQILVQIEARKGVPTALLVDDEESLSAGVPGMTGDAESLKTALKKLKPGTPVALAGFSPQRHTVLGDERAVMRQQIEQLVPSSLSGDIPSALLQAKEMLETSGDADRRVILVTDLQAAEWPSTPIEGFTGINLLVLSTGPASRAPNLGIESGSLSQREVDLGQSGTGSVVVRNYGRIESVPASLKINLGESGRPQKLPIPALVPSAAIQLSFPIHGLSRERNLLGSATIESPDDPLLYDNTWHFQLGIRPPARVLCINGVPSETSAGRETFFIANALSPGSAMSSGSAGIEVQTKEVDDLKGVPLFQYSVVILAGVEKLDKEMVGKLKSFVSDGGGLLAFAGRRASPENANAWPFLPASLGPEKSDEYVFLDAVSSESQVMSRVSRRAGSDLATLTTAQWFPLEPKTGAIVLGRFSNGSPAMVEWNLGRGRAVVVATGCHTSTSNWPLRPSFVLLMRSIVRDLSRPNTPLSIEPYRQIGTLAARGIDEELVSGTPAVFRVSLNDQGVQWHPMAWYRDGRTISMPAAEIPGHYTLSIQPGQAAGILPQPGVGSNIVPVSVNHDPTESDAGIVSEENLRERLPGVILEMKPMQEIQPGLIESMRTGTDLWRILVVVAFLILVAESLIAWRSQGNES
ncbi:MAG: BatA domain-containing protein [Planctomycetota bacterium]|nr:BatA domain-containing protein [Planctomycetota bacterium]